MLFAIVVALSLGVMLFIIASLLMGAWRRYRQQKGTQATKMRMPAHPLDRHVTMILHMQDGVVVSAEKPESQSTFTLPASWYTRLRTYVSLGLLLMVLLSLFVQSALADGTLQRLGRDLRLLGLSQASTTDVQTAAHMNASQQIVRISQLDPVQYSSSQEYNTWAYSACSAVAMTEVFNAYGHHFRIADVLKVEAQIGEISPALGMLEPHGIARTAEQFGFKTTWGNAWTLDQVIATANQGKPVIVSFPPDRYAGGHILVVIGGDGNTVYLADSSYWNRHSITRAQFLQWWQGYSAVVTPK